MTPGATLSDKVTPEQLRELMAKGGRVIHQPPQVPVLSETTFRVASFGFAIAPDGSPALTFEVPSGPGKRVLIFPFGRPQLDAYADALLKFREALDAEPAEG